MYSNLTPRDYYYKINMSCAHKSLILSSWVISVSSTMIFLSESSCQKKKKEQFLIFLSAIVIIFFSPQNFSPSSTPLFATFNASLSRTTFPILPHHPFLLEALPWIDVIEEVMEATIEERHRHLERLLLLLKIRILWRWVELCPQWPSRLCPVQVCFH